MKHIIEDNMQVHETMILVKHLNQRMLVKQQYTYNYTQTDCM